VRLRVVAHTVQSERHAENGNRRAGAQDERCKRLEPPHVEPQPRADGDDTDEDPAARVREQHRQHAAEHEQRPVDTPLSRAPQPEHDGKVAEQCQRAPEADRRAETRKPPVVRVQRRDRLREQRVRDHAPEQHRERRSRGARRMWDDRRDEETQDEEREIDEAAVEVVPRAVRENRPDDRNALPNDERRKTADAPHRNAAEARANHQTRKSRSREHRRRDHGRAADPRQPTRRVGAAEEERPHEQRDHDEERWRGNRRESAVAQRERRHRRDATTVYKALTAR
jgi:hypothetical protein